MTEEVVGELTVEEELDGSYLGNRIAEDVDEQLSYGPSS